MPCILNKYEVSVAGYGSAQLYAKNKNQARVRAFHSLQRANDAITFKRFLQIVGPIEQIEMPHGYGAPILVNGAPAFLLGSAGGNSMRFCWPNSDQVLLVHELDVSEPETVH